jgi:hypothetical protein
MHMQRHAHPDCLHECAAGMVPFITESSKTSSQGVNRRDGQRELCESGDGRLLIVVDAVPLAAGRMGHEKSRRVYPTNACLCMPGFLLIRSTSTH